MIESRHLQCQPTMPLLLLIAAMVSSYIAAQNTTFDPNSVDQTTKSEYYHPEYLASTIGSSC